MERLGPKLLGLKILSTELLKIPEHHDDHHHHEEHHDHEEDANPGHHGLKHKHDHHWINNLLLTEKKNWKYN